MRPVVKAALAVCAILVLTGCTSALTPSGHASNAATPLPKVNTMTPDEAVAQQLKPLADAAGKAIGPGWKPQGTLTPGAVGQEGDACTLPNGKHGVNFTVVWTGPGVADVDATAAEIQAEWKRLGTDVPIATDNSLQGVGEGRVLSDPKYNTGSYPDGYAVQLTIGTKSTFMQATTHCLIHGRD